MDNKDTYLVLIDGKGVWGGKGGVFESFERSVVSRVLPQRLGRRGYLHGTNASVINFYQISPRIKA